MIYFLKILYIYFYMTISATLNSEAKTLQEKNSIIYFTPYVGKREAKNDNLPLKTRQRANQQRSILNYLKRNHFVIGHKQNIACEFDHNCGPTQKCLRKECDCRQNYIRLNATHCLPGQLLGFPCELHSQCTVRVPGSSCIQGLCQCGQNMVPYRIANCLPASILGEKCRTDYQCSLKTTGSHCDWFVPKVLGTCRCKRGTMQRGNICTQPGLALGSPCGKTYDCSRHVPGSVCRARGFGKKIDEVFNNIGEASRKKDSNGFPHKKEHFWGGICQCPKGYIASKNNTKCISLQKDLGIEAVSLGKPCTFASQCELSDPFSTCRNGTCNCERPSLKCSAENTGCHEGTFQCVSDGQCISPNFVCNGVPDCQDRSDEDGCFPGRCGEINCSSSVLRCPHAFQCSDGAKCVSRDKVCDGKHDCNDGSDENCGLDKRTKGCPQSSFACTSGECVPGFQFCNALPACADGSDEDKNACIAGVYDVPHCPFRCDNGRCRSTAILCSGKNGCGDNSDEERCAVCSCPQP